MSNINEPQLYSQDTERYALTGLCQYPEILAELDVFVRDEDFKILAHKTLYQAIKSLILDKKNVNKVILTTKLDQLGIKKFQDDMPIGDYAGVLFETKVNKEAVIDFYKELSGFRVRREFLQTLREAAVIIKSTGEESAVGRVSRCEKIISERIIKSVNFNDGPVEILDPLEDLIEERGNNPTDGDNYHLGPFDTVNSLLGSLHRDGNITVWAARSKTGKSSMLFFYNVWMAEKYGLPLYWQDSAELSIEEVQIRAAACLSRGLVPLYDIENGLWRKNREYTKIIRDIWPRIKKMKIYYEDIGDMSPTQVVSAARRFQYSKVGKNKRFIWALDYLKPFDDLEGETEWRQFGKFIKSIKKYIKNEEGVSLQTAIQSNRSGISTGKTSNGFDKSENQVSQDRVTQQCSHCLILTRKTIDEIADEGPDFGNMKINYGTITRHLGKNVDRAMNYVKNPADGSYAPNFINIKSKNFHFEDCGDYVDIIEAQNGKKNIQHDDGSILPL